MAKRFVSLVAVALLCMAVAGVVAGCSCAPADQGANSSSTSSKASSAKSDSSSSDTVSVPDVVFLDNLDARQLLAHAGLAIGDVTFEYDDKAPLGVVVSQKPAAHEKVAKGTKVSIVVSKGKKEPQDVTMPDLMGKTQEEAEKTLIDIKLVPVPGNPVFSDTVAPGQVCQQSTKAGDKVKEGTQITFNVSMGKHTVRVPDLTGKTFEAAKAELAGLKLGVDEVTAYDDKAAVNSVIAQSVQVNTEVTEGTTITLTVSLGAKPAEKVTVPNIMTYTLQDAQKALESAGLACAYSGDVDGTVNAVNPAPGTQVDKGSTVKITLQHVETLVAIPDVKGMKAAQARAAIEQVGLKLNYDTKNPDRAISSTKPKAGTLVDMGTTIEAQYEETPTPETKKVAIPDLKGMTGTQAYDAAKLAGLDLDYDVRQPDRVLSGTDPAAGKQVDAGTMIAATYETE